MTAISSFRLFSESAEIAENQRRAKDSWDRVFDGIIYFGSPEISLISVKTEFVKSEEFPPIFNLMAAASMCKGWAAILNADIIVSLRLGAVVQECIRKGIKAISSYRYTFDPAKPDLDKATVTDLGFDFFMAEPAVWKAASDIVPTGYRIGHGRWDNWTLGFLNTHCGKRFVDVTSRRLIFHPLHGERKQPYHIAVPADKYLELGRPPFYKLP